MRRTAGVLAVLALAVAGCGGDEGDDEATDDTGESDATAAGAGAGTSDDGGEPSGEPDPNGMIRVSFGTNAGSNYDPHTAFNQFVPTFLYPAYDRLIELTSEAELEPMLAESWEFLDDDTVLRLELRQGVTFHDGESFDAEAVQANIERGKTLEDSSVRPGLAPIDSVEVVDEHTVDLQLSGPGAALPALLAGQAGMMISPAAFENDDLDLRPVGAGPYQVDEHQPGSVITFTPFSDYWDPDAQTLGGIEIQVELDPDARLRAIADGRVDVTSLNSDQVSQAESDGVEVETFDSTGAFLLYLNKTKEGLDDVRVRQAISLAIDRQGITEELHQGHCVPSNQVFHEGYWASSPDVVTDEQDLERAQALMDEAGYGDGLSLSGVVISVPFYSSQLEVLQAQLGEIGIDLSVSPLEPAELLSQFAGGEADVYYSMWPGAVDPSATVAGIFAEEASLNPGGYTNDELNGLASEGLAETDPDARAEIYQELSDVAAGDYFHIIVCNPSAITAQAPGVEGLAARVDQSLDFRGVTISG